MIPAVIKVGAFDYVVDSRPENIHHSQRGTCAADTIGINLNPHNGPSRMREVLLHEIAHAVLDHAGWRGQDDEDKTYSVEQFIDALSPGLLMVLRDNPELVAYLTHREKENDSGEA